MTTVATAVLSDCSAAEPIKICEELLFLCVICGGLLSCGAAGALVGSFSSIIWTCMFRGECGALSAVLLGLPRALLKVSTTAPST